MNKKVLKVMISLVISFLIGLYVLKFFFPEKFVLAVENEAIIKIGTYIDTHNWANWICTYITAFITYWLYCCACTRKWYLKWYECLYIVGIITIVRILTVLDSNLSTVVSVVSFVVLPAMMKGSLTLCAITYSIHGLSQGLSLTIRNLYVYLISVDTASILLLGFESYLWLLLLYLYFNFRKEKKYEN